MVKKFFPRSDFRIEVKILVGQVNFLLPKWSILGGHFDPPKSAIFGPIFEPVFEKCLRFFKNGSKKRKQKNLAVRTLGGGVVT